MSYARDAKQEECVPTVFDYYAGKFYYGVCCFRVAAESRMFLPLEHVQHGKGLYFMCSVSKIWTWLGVRKK